MVKKRSKRQEHSMAVDTAESGDGWQTGVSAFEAGPPDAERESGQDATGMDTTDIVVRNTKALKSQGPTMKVKQGTRGNRTKAQKKRKALKLAKALSHADRRGVRHSKKVQATAVKKDMKKLWTTEKKAAPVTLE